MIGVPQAHQVELGNKKVKVGVMDTGLDGTHPDIAPNFDAELSRNFVTDMTDIDGDVCEHPSCIDPVNEDDNGHGTHTAGTMAAALNGIGMSGIAPTSASSTSAPARTAATSSSAPRSTRSPTPATPASTS